MSTEKKVAAGAGSGCLVLFLFCGGCLGLSALVGPPERVMVHKSSAPERQSPEPAKLSPVASSQATPADELIRFARQCDDLLMEIDEAWVTRRRNRLTDTDDSATWGVFIRTINSRVTALREISSDFAPAEAKMQVGSIAGYLLTLAHDVDDQDPGEFTKYRAYLMDFIHERDAYLKSLSPDYVGKYSEAD